MLSRNLSNGRTYSISFSYEAENIVYKNGDTRCFEDSEKASRAFTDRDLAYKGDDFLVLYDKNNPKNAIIKLDYPIKDNSDFERYVKEFWEKRKKQNK